MPIVRVNAKGQVTLPKQLRERLGIATPGRIHVEDADGALVLRPLVGLHRLHLKYGPLLRGGPSFRTLLRENRKAERRRERRLDRIGRKRKRRP